MENVLKNNEAPNSTDNNEITEERLVANAIKGCKESFIAIIDLHKEYLYRTAYLYVKNEHDASEIYQNTVYKAYINIHKLKNPQYFKTWISRILLNNVYDNYRYNGRQATLNDELMIEDYSDYTKIEDKIDLYDAIDSLNYKYKTAIILKYIHGMSIKDMSSIMRCSENAIKSYVFRAKKELLKNLKGD